MSLFKDTLMIGTSLDNIAGTSSCKAVGNADQETNCIPTSAAYVAATSQTLTPATSELATGERARSSNPPTSVSRPTASTDDYTASYACPAPEDIRPFPKAGPRKKPSGLRKACKTLILTSTPVKDKLVEEHDQKMTRSETKGSKNE